jgi:hypothetical protein
MNFLPRGSFVALVAAYSILLLNVPASLGWQYVPSRHLRRQSLQRAASPRLRLRQLPPHRSPIMSASSTLASSKHDNADDIKVLGVCGGIGSGKSTACKLLVSQFRCLAHIGKETNACGWYSVPLSIISAKQHTVRQCANFHFCTMKSM